MESLVQEFASSTIDPDWRSSKFAEESSHDEEKSLGEACNGHTVIEDYDTFPREMDSFEDWLPGIEMVLRDLSLTGYSATPIQHGENYYHFVYALTSNTQDQQNYILRVNLRPDVESSVSPCDATLSKVALFGYLADKLPVPRIKAYNANVWSGRPFGLPWIVQTRVSGQELEKLYNDMRFSDKLEVVDQYVDLMAKIETVTFDKAGQFVHDRAQENAMDDFFISDSYVLDRFNGEIYDGIACHHPFPRRFYRKGLTSGDIRVLLTSNLNAMVALVTKRGGILGYPNYPSRLKKISSLRALIRMVEDMEGEKWFESEPQTIILHFPSHGPGDVMVDKNHDDEYIISGIIDWDEGEAIPRPLARKPPYWLWGPTSECPDVDYDQLVDSNLSRENQALKAYFDVKAAAALPGWLEDAYGRGRWLRRVWTFAKDDVRDQRRLDLMDQTLRDWAARPK